MDSSKATEFNFDSSKRKMTAVYDNPAVKAIVRGFRDISPGQGEQRKIIDKSPTNTLKI
jgi:hypothetical protein